MVRASTDDRRIPTEGVDDETLNDGVESRAEASNTLNEDDAIIEPSRFDEMEWSVPPATNPNESESPDINESEILDEVILDDEC